MARHAAHAVYVDTVHRGWGRDRRFPEGGARSECQITATQHQQKSSKINGPPYIFWARNPHWRTVFVEIPGSHFLPTFLSLHRLFLTPPWEPEDER